MFVPTLLCYDVGVTTMSCQHVTLSVFFSLSFSLIFLPSVQIGGAGVGCGLLTVWPACVCVCYSVEECLLFIMIMIRPIGSARYSAVVIYCSYCLKRRGKKKGKTRV